MNSNLPAPITFAAQTPRRKAESAAGSSNGDIMPVPSAPAVKNTLLPMPIAVNTNGVLLVEIEKVNVKIDEVFSEVGKIKAIIMVHAEVDISAPVVEVDSAVAVPPVPPVGLDVTHTLMMREFNEMRRVMACDQEKMRAFIRNRAIAMVVLIFVMTIVVVSHVHVIVYMLKEPVVFESSAPVCTPYFDCIAKFLAREIAKTTRDEWAH